MRPKVLFLCTANACRSQMAEGLARETLGELYDFYSAGTDPASVDPLAVEAMRELGIDITRHYSKSLEDLQGVDFDLVVTLCGDARDNCPYYPGEARVEHMGFEDPARAAGSEDEVIATYRRVRNDISEKLIPYLRKIFKDF
jgi:arsenate reductase